MVKVLAAAVVLTLTAGAVCGCRVSSNKDGKDNVEINSPFGNMSVKTNEAADTSAIGITVYPGATPWKDDKSDKDSANVNMNFGDFHLGVKAASFRTNDPVDKVIAFYRSDLAKFGDVLTCKGNTTVGKPERTSQGLTCSDDDKGSGHVNVDLSNDTELRAGSPTHQHIVGVASKDGSTKIALVALELPGHMGKHSGSIE